MDGSSQAIPHGAFLLISAAAGAQNAAIRAARTGSLPDAPAPCFWALPLRARAARERSRGSAGDPKICTSPACLASWCEPAPGSVRATVPEAARREAARRGTARHGAAREPASASDSVHSERPGLRRSAASRVRKSWARGSQAGSPDESWKIPARRSPVEVQDGRPRSAQRGSQAGGQDACPWRARRSHCASACSASLGAVPALLPGGLDAPRLGVLPRFDVPVPRFPGRVRGGISAPTW